MKTYVCSDIHGRKDRYDKALSIVGNNKLIVIGDSIDRGKDSFDTIHDIMLRDNVELMLGNHEWMMYQCLTGDDEVAGYWLTAQNGGIQTLSQYRDYVFNNPSFHNKFIDYLETCSVYKNLEVNGHKYHLVHGLGIKYHLSKESAGITDMTYRDINDSVWEGISDIGYSDIPDDIEVVCGHVYVQRLFDDCHLEVYRQNNFIDIDGGCALPDGCSFDGVPIETALILYCLDDKTIEYIR